MQQQQQQLNSDLYGLLNLRPDCTTEEIHQAYKSLSRTFHPDRLSRLQNYKDLQTAQETFVEVKNAHEILCDPVLRFAYDQHGWKGVNLIVRISKIPKKFTENYPNSNLSPYIGLQDQLRTLLSQSHHPSSSSIYDDWNNHSSIQQAKQLLQEAMEQYEYAENQQLSEQQQRMPVQFEGNMDYPCTYEYHRNSFEMESSYLNCMVRHTTKIMPPVDVQGNKETANKKSSTVPAQQPQQRIITTSMGTTVEWEHNGKAESTAITEIGYKPNSQSQISFMVNGPLLIPTTTTKRQSASNNTMVKQQMQSIMNLCKIGISTTHEFANGTAMVFGIRGSTQSLKHWSYSIVTQRILNTSYQQRQQSNNENNNKKKPTKIYASWALGLRAMDGKVSYCLTTIKTIPPLSASVIRQQQKKIQQQKQKFNQQQQQQQQQTTYNNFNALYKKWKSSFLPSWWSIPVLKIKFGIPSMLCNLSTDFDYFGYEWLSLYASMVWNSSSIVPKAKLLVSTTVGSSGNPNSRSSSSSAAAAAVVKTGFRHDDLLGWIWLWEWEASDWTFRIPISLASLSSTSSLLSSTSSRNSRGLLLRIVEYYFHEIIFWSLITCTVGIVSGILKDLYFDTTANNNPIVIDSNNKKKKKSKDHHDGYDSDEDDSDSDNDYDIEGTKSSTKKQNDNIEDDNDDDNYRTRSQFLKYMIPIANKKRELEEENNGLVILSAKRTYYFASEQQQKGQIRQTQKGQQQKHTDYYNSIRDKSKVKEEDLTYQLQFWVVDGKLCIPFLSTYSNHGARSMMNWIGLMEQSNNSMDERQHSPHQQQRHGGADTATASLSAFSWVSNKMNSFYAFVTRRNSNMDTDSSNGVVHHSTRIRYKFKDYVYEIVVNDTESILTLPNENAQCLGKSGVVT